MTSGLVYYSHGRGNPAILEAVRRRLDEARGHRPIVAVTLERTDLPTGWKNVVLNARPGQLTMFQQIMAGLLMISTDVAFLVEHDVLYHDSHFDLSVRRHDAYYYNQNVWKVDAASGKALFYFCNQTSGLFANRLLLAEHYRQRCLRVEREGFTQRMGYEPGTRKVRHGGIDDVDVIACMSALPNIDIRHDKNLTPSRWSKDEFRNQKYTEGWTEADSVPGWGRTAGRFDEFLKENTYA